MKDDIKSDLDTIFRTHQEKKENAQKLEEEKGRREEEFLSQFYLHQKTTIRPAMEAVGKYLSEKGYSCRIDESKDEITHDVKRRGASISICFLVGRDPLRPSHEYPHFTVFCDKHAQRARFSESTISPGLSGRSGAAGEAPLNEVTEELIHKKIIKILTEVFK